MNLKLNSFNWIKTNLIFLLGLFFVFNFLSAQNVWAVDETTVEDLIPNEFQGGGVAQGWNGDDAEWDYTLPFTFNFYGVDYTDIKVGSNGVICLDNTKDCTWYPDPDFTDSYMGPVIAPMGTDLQTNFNSTNDIYITENADNVVIRWDAVEYGLGDQINFEVILYDSGNIRFNYGTQDGPLIWSGARVGITNGDGMTYTNSPYNNGTNFNMVSTSSWGAFGSAIIALSPTDDAVDVATDANLTITFDGNAYKGVGNIYVKKVSDDSIVETIDAASANISGWGTNTITINLSSGFNYYAEYYINIDAGFVENSSGDSFGGISNGTTWNFRTQSTEYIVETIPDDECYEIGSAEASQPAGSTLSYSNDDQSTWAYVPQDDGAGKDCSVTDIKLAYDDIENVAGEDLEAEFMGTFNDTEVVSAGNGKVFLDTFYPTTTKTFGGTSLDNAHTISTDSSGNIFTAGYFVGTVDFDAGTGVDSYTSNGGFDVFITKYNADGSYGWTKTFGGVYEDRAYGISTDSLGNIFTVGKFQETVDFDAGTGIDSHTANGSFDVFITKYNADGSYGWTKTFGGAIEDVAYGVSTDSSGNIFTAGYFQETADFDAGTGIDSYTSNGYRDVFITKYNADGSYGWTKTFGGTSSENAYGIDIDSSGNIFATGDFQETVDFDAGAGTDSHTSNGYNDIFITKYNADGSYGWTKTFGGVNIDIANTISIDNSENIFIAGEFQETVDFDAGTGIDSHTSNGNRDIFITKYNADGSYGWTKTFGGTSYDTAHGVSTDSSGNIFVAGNFDETVDFDAGTGIDSYTSNGYFDVFITKYNADGSYGWTNAFGGTSYDYAYGITTDSSGNIFTTGNFRVTVDFDAGTGVDSYTSNGLQDIFMVKYNSDGSYGSFDEIYHSLGTYQALITPSDVPPLSWGVFEATQTVPVGTSLAYEIFDSTCTTSLMAQTTDTTIDLSGIDVGTYGELCVEMTFGTTDNQVTPSLDTWSTTYILPMSDVAPSFDFATQSVDGTAGDTGGSDEDDGDNNSDNNNDDSDEDDDSEEEKELSIDLYNIKNIKPHSVDLRVEVEDYEDDELDFKVKVKNKETGESYTVKITEKVSDSGKATLTIEDLLPDTKYSFKVKVSEKDESDYTDYSDSKYATIEEEYTEENPQNDYPITDEPINETPDDYFDNENEDEDENEENKKENEPVALNVINETESDDTENSERINKETITAITVLGLLTGVSVATAASGGSIPLVPIVPNSLQNPLFSRLISRAGRKSFFSILQLLPFLSTTTKRKFALPYDRNGEDPAWGVAFDSYTKQPVPNALIQLIDHSKRRVVNQVTTDNEGRYGFLIDRDGEYALNVSKGEYKLKVNNDSDSLYGKVYNAPISLKAGEIAKINIALDSNSFNWKKFSENMLKRYHSFFFKSLKYILDMLYVIGILFSIYAVIYYPSFINYAILIFYIVLLAYRAIIYFSTKKHGTVISKEDKKPLSFTVIELYDKLTNQRVGFTVSDMLGRYYLLADNGKYGLKVKYAGGGESIEGESEITVKDGILREDLMI